MRVLLIVVMLAAGCGSSLKTLTQISAAADTMRQAAQPVLDARCMAAAKKCGECPAYLACKSWRRSIYAAHEALQLIVATAAGLLAAGADPGKLLGEAVAGMGRLAALIQSGPLVPASMPAGGTP